MTKPRAVRHADGRIGFPDIAVYELTEGPCAGDRVSVPPTYATHPLPGACGAKGPLTRPGCAYRILVLDRPAYDEFKAKGFWLSIDHLGGKKEQIDERPTPVG